MAYVKTIDPAGTATLSETANGVVDTMHYLIADLPVDAFTSRSAAAAAPGVPRVGEGHPVYPSLQVTRVTVGALKEGHRLVSVTWEQPRDGQTTLKPIGGGAFGPARWTGNIRTVTEQTMVDANGDRMLTYFSGKPLLETLDIESGAVTERAYPLNYRAAKYFNAELDRGLLQLSARRWERDDPLTTAERFASVINADQWNGFAPATVLSDGVQFEPVDGGGFNVDYFFTINRDTWRVQHAIEIFGTVPLNAEIGNGMSVFDVYPSEAFSRLELNR